MAQVVILLVGSASYISSWHFDQVSEVCTCT